MLKLKLVTLLFAFKNLLTPSIGEKKFSDFRKANEYKFEKVGQLPDSVKESSGIEIAESGKTFWTHGDGGCKSQLYEISNDGKVKSILPLVVANQDWEEIAKDENGNIYIGDFGNNMNKRTNLCVYKINPFTKNVDTISFSYSDQFEFPPPKSRMNFDCEAMFCYNDSLYLFSKNRGDDWVRVYRLPTEKGKYMADIHQKIYLSSMITSADLSPDGKTVALLSYGKIYFLTISDLHHQFKASYSEVFNRSKQSEALVFINNNDLLISNEQGNLYLAKKKR